MAWGLMGFVSPVVDSALFIICTICMRISLDAHNTQLAIGSAGCSLGSKHNTRAGTFLKVCIVDVLIWHHPEQVSRCGMCDQAYDTHIC